MKIYDAAFPTKAPDDEFWSDMDTIDQRFASSFEEPVTDSGLRTASSLAIQEFREACSKARKR